MNVDSKVSWIRGVVVAVGIAAGLGTAAAAQPEVPEFSVEAVRASGGAILKMLPPAGHHFNVDAPMDVRVSGQKLSKKKATAAEVQFGLPKASSQGELTATLYLCDDANTYCIKKVVKKALDAIAPPGAKNAVSSPKSRAGEPAKDRVYVGLKKGFIYNDPDRAFAQARKTQKLLLVDFYGIWCPPCNVLDETVFPSPEFRKSARSFVLLKLDADAKVSWPLKERYKVGGYPTIVLADSAGEEIGRVVGLRGSKAFAALMDDAVRFRDAPLSSLAARAEAGDAQALERLGVQALERGEAERAIDLLQRASKSWPERDHRWARFYEAKLKKEKTPQLMQEAIDKTAPCYFQLDTALSLANELKTPEAYARAAAVGEELLKAQTGSGRQDEEAAAQDIWILTAEAYEGAGRPADARRAYGEAAKIYRKSLAKLGKRADGERGWNLELAYCLRKTGDSKGAERIYSRLQKRYPGEFTYYYSHAGMVLDDLKDAKRASQLASKAFERSYGDNRIRSAQLLAKAYRAQGKGEEALVLIRRVLADTPAPSDPDNRTHRYLKSLRALEAEIAAGK